MPATAPPRDEASLLDSLRNQLGKVLPATWRSELVPVPTHGAPPSFDALVRITAPDGREALFAAEAKVIVNPRDVAAALWRVRRAVEETPALDAGRTVPLIVARYLNPRAREMLESEGASYADATGNLLLSAASPALFVRATGAQSDPWRAPDRAIRTLKGAPAAKVIRALVDFRPPFRIRTLSARSGASLGSTYRVVDFLERDALLERDAERTIVAVDWERILRRWSEDYGFLRSNEVIAGFEPRGIDRVVDGLRTQAEDCVITGSLAAVRVAEVAQPRLAMLFARDPAALAHDLGLRDSGPPNVLIARPFVPVLMERAEERDGLRYAALSQTAVDLLSGPGRAPAEAEALLDWMRRNESSWRR